MTPEERADKIVDGWYHKGLCTLIFRCEAKVQIRAAITAAEEAEREAILATLKSRMADLKDMLKRFDASNLNGPAHGMMCAISALKEAAAAIRARGTA